MNLLSTTMIPAKAVDPATGLLIDDMDCWTNWEPIEFGAGSAIAKACAGYQYRVSIYHEGFDEELAHTYNYDAESNWTTFASCTEPGVWLEDFYKFSESCFVRITVRRVDGYQAVTSRTLEQVVVLSYVAPEEKPQALWAQEEIERVCARVDQLREPDDAVFILLSDIHYSTGCIWPQTARNVQAVAERIHPDALVQLGDVVDGTTPADVTRSFAARVLNDMHVCGLPVYGCVGNHDANYFKGNAQLFSAQECAHLFTDRDELWFYEDFPARRLRCFFLQSFDATRKPRYGYAFKQVRWLHKMLRHTPTDYRVLVFSHLPLYAQIHYWSDTLLGEEYLSGVLDRFNRRTKGSLRGFVHGHSHADQVFWKQSFPDISIGCAKFEDFQECKPEGSLTPLRYLGTVSQDLWNVMIVKGRENKLHLVRFGAGDDYKVDTYDPR